MDVAWVVVDKDNWTDLQLSGLKEWAVSGENYRFALSNTKF
jgi:hypothetical protein